MKLDIHIDVQLVKHSRAHIFWAVSGSIRNAYYESKWLTIFRELGSLKEQFGIID